MREILFRGKREVNGEWVYGAYVHYDDIKDNHKDDCDYIVGTHTGTNFPFCKVIPETVGQYTGLTDKNGTKIFEGDIVKGTFLGFPVPFYDYTFSISWQKDVTGYKANYFENVEVIGNIYDNHELLKGEE